jgi:hypothetical protein
MFSVFCDNVKCLHHHQTKNHPNNAKYCRAFSRRLINATCKVTKPHHRIRVSQEMREDLKVWLSFLSDYNGITVMLDNVWTSNEDCKSRRDTFWHPSIFLGDWLAL